MPDFVHLHCHTQFSLLDGANTIPAMMKKAKEDGQAGVALTDHGNMFGAFKFVAEAEKNDLKPIVGCEFYLVEDRHRKSFSPAKGQKDKRYHQLLLAKNQKGYENLTKLASLGYIEGLYGKYPRIDKELLEQYHEGIIATSCCIGAEIPQAILHKDYEKAEKLIRWYHELFGEDFYIELQRQRGLENIDGLGVSQEDVNMKLLEYANKYKIKTIVTNDAHYLNEEDAVPHDLLLCVNTASNVSDEDRFRFSSSDYYFKTQEEMNATFKDLPEAVDNTTEILDKVEKLNLRRDILMPAFPIPEGFQSQADYLRHLTYEGARKRYGELSEVIRERIDFELNTIISSKYEGYFLIVQDFTTVARELGVWVGPGRGSAAGSAVAYCLGITNIDPIKYKLLFERFLNPERISMPDIDIDFDDEGRQKVIDYVVDKYGKNQVAQIITYGTMAAKSAIRDVGRVLGVPLHVVDGVAKSFPSHAKATLSKILEARDIEQKLKEDLSPEDREKAYKLREIARQEDSVGEMLRMAQKLEGSLRSTGIHACGIVITPDEITKYVPVSKAKNSELLVTQFDNEVAEDAGLLKMDFLGLKTLSIVKDAARLVKERRGIDINPDEIPLDEPAVYELFQRGETIGLFQYESDGMQKHLRELVPDTFEDLIAMNALYRPGPMAKIPDFIARKHGRQKISYDLPEMEEFLSETYGITVYQEQVMLLSQKLAGFSKGQADSLRKAMGKKKKALIDKMYPLFIEGGKKNGHPEDVLNKIWGEWEAFASYAFNKSHSTCYAYLAYQTAYFKALYKEEYMASVLTHNKSDLAKITFFLRESKRMGIPVLSPDINESQSDFSVNEKGQIRFGLSAPKGVGEGPVTAILEERKKNGPFKDFLDFARRMPQGSINKRVVESLANGGAFDCFEELHRAQYFAPSGKYETYLEHALRYGQLYQHEQTMAANSLFGDSTAAMIPIPQAPPCEPWPLIQKLQREREVTGIFVSGHPLDDYRIEVETLTNCPLQEIARHKDKNLRLAGLVLKAEHRISKKGNGWGAFAIQDYSGVLEFRLFGESYQQFKAFLEEGQVIYMEGRYQKSWKGEEYEFRPGEIRQLEAMGQQLVNGIELQIPVTQLQDKLLAQLLETLKTRKGPHRLRITLIDPIEKQSLNTTSRKLKIRVDNQLILELERLGILYKILTDSRPGTASNSKTLRSKNKYV